MKTNLAFESVGTPAEVLYTIFEYVVSRSDCHPCWESGQHFGGKHVLLSLDLDLFILKNLQSRLRCQSKLMLASATLASAAPEKCSNERVEFPK
jgi:hypothetical protein